MSQEITPKVVVDSIGKFCPVPITDLLKAYRQSNVGDVIELLAIDPAAKQCAETWARRSGNEVLKFRKRIIYAFK